MAIGEDAGERRRHPRFQPAAELYVMAAKNVGRVLNIGQGGVAFSYVRFQEDPLAADCLDLFCGHDELLRDLPIQALSEHRLENQFVTSPVDVRCCRVTFGALTDEQRQQVSALIERHAHSPAPVPTG